MGSLAAMAESNKLHIFIFPFMASGHMIPMVDMAKLFAMRGVKSTVIATPANAPSFLRSIEPSRKLGFDIHVITIRLPEISQNINSLRSPDMLQKFLKAVGMMDRSLEKLIEEHRPDCLVADMFLPWTTAVAAKFGMLRLVLHRTSYFSLGALECMRLYRPFENVSADSEPFLIPKFPVMIHLSSCTEEAKN